MFVKDQTLIWTGPNGNSEKVSFSHYGSVNGGPYAYVYPFGEKDMQSMFASSVDNFKEWVEPRKFEYDYARPAVGVDLALFLLPDSEFDSLNLDLKKIEVVTIKRGHDPYKGCKALPGGHNNDKESFKNACIRETKEEINVDPRDVTFIGLYDDPNRDPRGWTISSCFSTIMRKSLVKPILKAGDDAEDVSIDNLFDISEEFRARRDQQRWTTVDKTYLAFDHGNMIAHAFIKMFSGRIGHDPLTAGHIIGNFLNMGQL